MFLITGKILSLDDPARVGEMLGMYMVTVLTGLILHAAVILPLIYFIIVRKNPLRIFIGILQAFVTALGTASRSVWKGGGDGGKLGGRGREASEFRFISVGISNGRY